MDDEQVTTDDPIEEADDQEDMSLDEAVTGKPDTESEEATSEEEAEADVEETESSDKTEEDEPENQNDADQKEPETDAKEEARRRYQERKAQKQQREQQIQDQLKQYVEEAEDAVEQRLRAIEVREYQNHVDTTEKSIISEFERAKNDKDLQIFNPENKDEFNEKAFNRALRDYEAGYMQTDEYGNIVGTRESFYNYLKEEADLLSSFAQSGARKGQQAEAQMRAQAETPPARNYESGTEDDLDALEERLADVKI